MNKTLAKGCLNSIKKLGIATVFEPFHQLAPKACAKDPELYEMLALVDAMRVGEKREYKIALKELSSRI